MEFPKISNETVGIVRKEVELMFVRPAENAHEYRRQMGRWSNWAAMCLAREMPKNSILTCLLTRMMRNPTLCQTRFLMPCAVSFGIVVYKLIAQEFKAQGLKFPTIADEVGLPILAEYERNGAKKICEQIDGWAISNPALLLASEPWTKVFIEQKDDGSVGRVMFSGLMVYQFIKGQWDSDELTRQIGHKIQ